MHHLITTSPQSHRSSEATKQRHRHRSTQTEDATISLLDYAFQDTLVNFLLLIASVLIVVITINLIKKRRLSAPTNGGIAAMKKCPQCNKLNSNQSATCEYCNADLGEPTIIPPPTAAPAQKTTAPATMGNVVKICPQCNTTNKGQFYCTHCGASLKDVVGKEDVVGKVGREPPPPATPPSNTIPTTQQTQQTGAFSVTVPLGEKWQPAQAEQLMTTLFNLTPVTLEIAATNNAINWHILPDPRNREAVTRAILSLYPNANLTPVTEQRPSYTTAQHVRCTTEFFSPLAYADDLKTVDPLTSIVGAMSHLQQGEQVVFLSNENRTSWPSKIGPLGLR